MYGCFLCHIFENEGIDCSLDVGLPLSSPINLKSLKKSCWELVGKEWKRKGKRPVEEDLDDILRDVDDLMNIPKDEPPTGADAALGELNLPPHFRMMMESFYLRLATMQSQLEGRLSDIQKQQSLMQTDIHEIRTKMNAKFERLFAEVGRSHDASIPPAANDE